MTIEKRIRGMHYHQWLEDTDGIPLGVEILGYDGTGQSMQGFSSMLGLAAGAGSSTSTSPKYLGGLMAEVHGASSVDTTVNLTRTANIVAAIIAKYSHVGTNASTYMGAALRAEIGASTTAARAAVLAVLGGDNGVTSAGAAFAVDSENSTSTSRFNDGLDLEGTGVHDSYLLPRYNMGFIRMGGRVVNAAGAVVTVTNIRILGGTAAPTDGTSGTGAANAGPGSVYMRQDGTDSNFYINRGSLASPTWVTVGGLA